MTNVRQAAMQALEALESSRIFVITREKTKHPEGTEWYDSAITALKAALEQPEQEPEQEPVAWQYKTVEAGVFVSEHRPVDVSVWQEVEWSKPLYTTPPAAQAAPVQEPVVFYRCNGCGHAYEQVHPTSCDCMDAGGFDRVEYFTTPPPAAQPEQEFDYKLAFGEWLDKTEWVQEKINSGHLGVRYLGMHRADVLRDLAYPNTVTGKAPQQRTWVGLTDEDMKDPKTHILDFIYGARWAEAKLKERNT
jgi:hypothetical protein